MKNIILLFITIGFLTSCSNSNGPEFLNYNWKQMDRVWIKDGKFNSYTHFDPASGEMVGDSLIPMEFLSDSMFVIINVGPKGTLDDNFNFTANRDTIYRDTVTYEVREFNGPKLILHPVNGKNPPIVYQLDGDKKIATHLTKELIKFQIAGYSIGDTIDRDNIEIEYVHNYGGRAVEIARLKNNKDVEINVIGGKYINEITQFRISANDLKDVIQVVSHKMGMEPKHTPPKQQGEYESEYYDWDKNGVSITLQRNDYTGGDTSRRYTNNDWNLYYEDDITSSLLRLEFADGTPKSTIIN